MDLEQEAWRYCQALGFKRNVELIVKHSSTYGTGGKQWLMVTTMTIGYAEDLAVVLQVLLHEICHVQHTDHSEIFIALMVEKARAVWWLNVEGWTEVVQGRHENRAYAVDAFLRERLRTHLAEGGYEPCQQ